MWGFYAAQHDPSDKESLRRSKLLGQLFLFFTKRKENQTPQNLTDILVFHTASVPSFRVNSGDDYIVLRPCLPTTNSFWTWSVFPFFVLHFFGLASSSQVTIRAEIRQLTKETCDSFRPYPTISNDTRERSPSTSTSWSTRLRMKYEIHYRRPRGCPTMFDRKPRHRPRSRSCP